VPEIPVIDISGFIDGASARKRTIATAVNRACEEIGFFVITGHGVDAGLCGSVFKVAGEFFDLPLEEKLRVKQWRDDLARGYSAPAAESVSYSRGEWTPGDLKESFSMGPLRVPEGHFAANLWPKRPRELKDTLSRYFIAMERLAATLMHIFAAALDLPERYFDDKIDRHASLLRVLNYPDQPAPPLPNQWRAGAHTDYDGFTILRQEDELRPGGLQVRTRAGEWIDVPVIPDSFVINIGDMLMQWTNDGWVSTEHQVVNPPRERALGSRRMSIPFFHTPNYDAVIECLPGCSSADRPPKYAPVRSGDWARMKFRKQVTFAEGDDGR
jgi:isopenicillin N synthase-like dioxygenase